MKSTDPISSVNAIHVPEKVGVSDSESDSEDKSQSITPRHQRKIRFVGSRRQRSCRSKRAVNYRDIFALF